MSVYRGCNGDAWYDVISYARQAERKQRLWFEDLVEITGRNVPHQVDSFHNGCFAFNASWWNRLTFRAYHSIQFNYHTINTRLIRPSDCRVCIGDPTDRHASLHAWFDVGIKWPSISTDDSSVQHSDRFGISTDTRTVW